jgi:rhodanese-related sulfurtransferase/CBS domain-containing protein
MPTEIKRDEIRGRVEGGAQLVEVLPAKEYEEEHLPGAINIPLEKLGQQATAKLQPARPVIVYCADSQWDLSARAAGRLESLGFCQVFRYVAGKAGWFASGLSGEGKRAGVPRAGDLARQDVPTCRLTDEVGDVQNRIQAAGWEVCVVVNDRDTVLGLLQEEAFDSDPQVTAERVMESAPTTIRPNRSLEETIKSMRKQKKERLLVTTSDGQLVGLLNRKDAERRLDDLKAATTAGSKAQEENP